MKAVSTDALCNLVMVSNRKECGGPMSPEHDYDLFTEQQ
jgi:hypothetical protein